MHRLISIRSTLPRFGLPVVVTIFFYLAVVGACRSSSPAQVPPPEAPSGEPAVEKPPEDFNNTIKWSTASELDNFGYDVYRSESEDGPFERLNTEVIEGAGTTDEVTRYQFVDDTIDPHKTYYYYVESISMSGVRERFTPIAKTLPKISPGNLEEN